ncbi:MAG: hypothetical protein N2606_00075 [Candidatus Omnitrophica bacterium]|nr:hypothetical protein [Candidatus Omnitrophota bacterium]
MLNKHSLSKILLISMFFLFAGESVASQQSHKEEKSVISKKVVQKQDIEFMLARIEQTYETKAVPVFLEVLDRDLENRLSFINSLEQYFNSVKFLNIYFVLDSFLTDQDKVLVRIHWFRKAVNNAGVFVKTKGNSEFVLRDTTDGLKLLRIRKDNPFF